MGAAPRSSGGPSTYRSATAGAGPSRSSHRRSWPILRRERPRLPDRPLQGGNWRVLEDEVLARAEQLAPDDTSLDAQFLRDAAQHIIEKRDPLREEGE